MKRTARWADVEASEDEEEEAQATLPTSDNSYLEAPVAELEDSRTSLSRRLAEATRLGGGPQDFTSLLKQAPATPEAPSQGSRWQPNAQAPEFIPTLSMACPLVAFCHIIPEDAFTPEKAVHRGDGLFADRRGRATASKRRPPALQVLVQKRTKSEERQSLLAQGEMPEATEEEWQHRIEMREKAIRVGKKTQEYQRLASLRAQKELNDDDQPLTPDPTDRTVSKRHWKYVIQQWRLAIKQLYVDEGHGSVASTEEWQSVITGTTEDAESHCTNYGDDDSSA